MSRFVVLAALGLVLGPVTRLHAQITATAPQAEADAYSQRWDFFGGYQYAHFNPSNGLSIEAVNLTGWTGSATLWFHPRWGIEADARGEYGVLVIPPNSENVPKNPPMSENLELFGPSFRMYRSPKVMLGLHFLEGAAYGKFSSGFPAGTQPQDFDIYNDKLAFGMAWGGIADYNVTSRWSVRFVADWQPTHYGFSWQNEGAGSVGLVYKFGSLHK